jgi:hypothetical protein
MMIDALNKLCKWRGVLAGWHNGTRAMNAPGTQAMRDLMDKWLILRCETSALAALLVQKDVFTTAEFSAAVHREAAYLDKGMEDIFPGFRTSQDGVVIYDTALAQQTMQRLGFPP